MKVYRVEDQKNRLGIWRDFYGNISPVFSKLSDGLARNLEMPDEGFYRFENSRWFAATDTPQKLRAWFSAMDVFELVRMGYKVVEFEVGKIRNKSEYEVVFRREDVLHQRIVKPQEIWPEIVQIQYAKEVEACV